MESTGSLSNFPQKKPRCQALSTQPGPVPPTGLSPLLTPLGLVVSTLAGHSSGTSLFLCHLSSALGVLGFGIQARDCPRRQKECLKEGLQVRQRHPHRRKSPANLQDCNTSWGLPQRSRAHRFLFHGQQAGLARSALLVEASAAAGSVCVSEHVYTSVCVCVCVCV